MCMFLNLKRQLRMVLLISMVMLRMKRIGLVWYSQVLKKSWNIWRRLWNIILFHPICWSRLIYSHRDLRTIGKQRRSYLNTCVILGHGKSGCRGEYLSFLILMLWPPKMNAKQITVRLQINEDERVWDWCENWPPCQKYWKLHSCQHNHIDRNKYIDFSSAIPPESDPK